MPWRPVVSYQFYRGYYYVVLAIGPVPVSTDIFTGAHLVDISEQKRQITLDIRYPRQKLNPYPTAASYHNPQLSF